MDTLLETLPERPLSREEVIAICDSDKIDWGAAPATTDDGEVYTFLLVFNENAYGIGYDEESSRWGVIHKVDRESEGGVAKLDTEISEWAEEVYGSKADDIAPNLPDVSQYK